MNYTEEQLKDIDERRKAFVADFDSMMKDLREKHQCDLVIGIQAVPSPSGVHGLMPTQEVQDLKYKPVPSPEEFVKNA